MVLAYRRRLKNANKEYANMSFRRKLKKLLRKCARFCTDALTHKARDHVKDEYHKNLAECAVAQHNAVMRLEAEYHNECKQVNERLEVLEASKQEQEQKYQYHRCL
jgi:hypothetical protein